MNNKRVYIGFGSICFIATIVMAILKLAGVLACAWWLVFLPIMVSVTIDIILFIVFVIIVNRLG